MNQVVPARAVKAPLGEDVKSNDVPVKTTPCNYKGFVGGVFSGIAKLSVS